MPVQIPYPYFELELDAKGNFTDAKQLPALIDGLKKNKTTDLFIVSHGWNNDEKEAHALYQELFNNVKAQEKNVDVKGRTFAVAGIIWPSKKFDAAEDSPNAASIGKNHDRLNAQVDTLAAVMADAPGAAKHTKDLARAKTLIPKLDKDSAARREFGEIILARLPKSVGEEGGWFINEKVGSDMIADDTFLKQLGSPPPKVAQTGGGGATSMGHKPPTQGNAFQGSAGLGDFFKGIVAGAANLLNYVTYYQMKDRAGIVGRAGVNQAIQRVRADTPAVRIHLVGHSFGCRVVTAAATGPTPKPKGFVNSMTLLQAAFSHYSFSAKFDDKNPGFYRNLVSEGRVSGPIIITHTHADKAVGLAYAIASRAIRQIASAMGDKNDPFGGLGSNGAQKTAEAKDMALPKAGAPFEKPLTKGSMTNLLADGLITSHSDVRNPNAAYAVLSAARAGAD